MSTIMQITNKMADYLDGILCDSDINEMILDKIEWVGVDSDDMKDWVDSHNKIVDTVNQELGTEHQHINLEELIKKYG